MGLYGLPDTLPGYMPADYGYDPAAGTDVRMPDGTMRHFDAGQQPKIFIGDEFPGGYAAAVPGTPEYDHYSSMQQRSNLQGVAKVGALVGGGALLGNVLGGSAAASGAAPVGEAAGIGGQGALAGEVAAAGGGAVPGAIAGAGGGAAGGAAGGASVASGAAGLGGLGLGGWLTVGSLVAGALQGNKPQTTTSTNDPPAYLKPYLGQAADAAQQQFANGAYVSPLQQSAVKYGNDVLSGNYLNSNPYLDATFQKAAGAVTNQVQSNFGLAGRNVRGPDAAGLAADKYSELAAQIYGGNYQAERDRQQQILPMTNQLGTIGNPNTALDDYIARLRNIGGGYGSTTSSTPTQSNLYSGLAGLGLALIPGG